MNEEKEARENCQIRKKVPGPGGPEEKEICDNHVFLTTLQVDTRKLTGYLIMSFDALDSPVRWTKLKFLFSSYLAYIMCMYIYSIHITYIHKHITHTYTYPYTH